jgi:hypothetical protein
VLLGVNPSGPASKDHVSSYGRSPELASASLNESSQKIRAELLTMVRCRKSREPRDESSARSPRGWWTSLAPAISGRNIAAIRTSCRAARRAPPATMAPLPGEAAVSAPGPGGLGLRSPARATNDVESEARGGACRHRHLLLPGSGGAQEGEHDHRSAILLQDTPGRRVREGQFSDMTGAPAAVGKQASQPPLTRRLPGTIRRSPPRPPTRARFVRDCGRLRPAGRHARRSSVASFWSSSVDRLAIMRKR